MENNLKRRILEARIAALRGHIEHVERPQPAFERELQKTEDELRAIPVEGTGSGIIKAPHGR